MIYLGVFMKKLWFALSCSAVLCFSPVQASQPTDINYCARGTTALGVKYSTYTVRCSDGKNREITSWNRRKKWCVGTSRRCTNDQLKAAKMACSQR